MIKARNSSRRCLVASGSCIWIKRVRVWIGCSSIIHQHLVDPDTIWGEAIAERHVEGIQVHTRGADKGCHEGKIIVHHSNIECGIPLIVSLIDDGVRSKQRDNVGVLNRSGVDKSRATTPKYHAPLKSSQTFDLIHPAG
eukprot:XP_001705912.1 Hypothetical protein GL50803_96777 [Giardia lamblia ATCC 50803]